MRAKAKASPKKDLISFLEYAAVAYVGTLAHVTDDQLRDVVEKMGGQLLGDPDLLFSGVLILGGMGLPLTGEGRAPLPDNDMVLVISEKDFLAQLKVATDGPPFRMHTEQALAKLLRLPRGRIRAWCKAGLIKPALIQHGVMKFDFREVVAAQTLADLLARGVSVRKIRTGLEQLRRWMPEVDRPLGQLSILEASGEMILRLERGELAQPDGQFHIDFSPSPDGSGHDATGTAAPLPLPIDGQPQLRLVGPRSAADWHDIGVEQEQAGLLSDAESSYRQALLVGGPDPRIAFDLAHVLAAQGRHDAAAERYRQVIEAVPDRADAWNNLGTSLSVLNLSDEAAEAFREAVQLDPNDPLALYNLADTLTALGDPEARDLWRRYLRLDPTPSDWSRYARAQLG